VQPEVVPGERLAATFTAKATGRVPVRWTGLQALGGPVPGLTGANLTAAGVIVAHRGLVPRDLPLTQPYWLREEGQSGLARVDDPRLIGQAENAPAFPVEYRFEFNGETLVVGDDLAVMEKTKQGERRRRVDVIPPVSLRLAAEVVLFSPGASRAVEVEVSGARAGVRGTLQLQLPAGWKSEPASREFAVAAVGAKFSGVFTVTAPAGAVSGRLLARATVDGVGYSSQRVVIDYPHLPVMLLQPPARARLVVLDVAARGKIVGYLPGAGDDTERALRQLGYEVRVLKGDDLRPEKLAGVDAVVIGVRAFNEREDLKANLAGLFAYVENGGTVIAQYNRPNGLATPTLGPYELSIQGSPPQLRVTDERAPVSFLAPQHPILTTPNRLGPADFAGWVQERGAYFPSSWDRARYETVLAMNDPGEAPLQSSILVARHGRGHYVYTGVAFFRQLPAGVPGAYRLFANLVSLGK
jgi:hypothetical protein